MAKEIVINVSLESQGVVENIQKIETELAKLNAERDALLNSGLSTDALTSSLNSLDGEISQLNNTYNKLVQSTNSYELATEKANIAADKAAQAQKNVEQRIKTAEGVTKTLAGSVNLATSAFAIFGVENEQVAETLLKVQAAAAFSTGIKDLTEGFKALNLAGLSLNKTLLANPFILIATLVATLITSFVGFDEIIKVLTQTLSAAFAPLTALFGVFQTGEGQINTAADALERYEDTLRSINDISKVTNALLESELALLEAQGAGLEEISAKRTQLLKDELNQTITTQNVTADYIDQLKFLQEQEAQGSKEYVRLQGEINKATSEVQNLKAKGIELDTRIQVEAIKLQKDIEKREKDARDKAKSQRDKDAADRKTNLEKEKNDAIKALQDRLKVEGDIVKAAGDVELTTLKQQLLNKKISEDTFNAEVRLLQIKTNDELIKIRQKFSVDEKTQRLIGVDETKKVLNQVNNEILDTERKNIDIRLAISRKNDDDLVKAEEKTAKDRVDVVEKDYLRKKQQLLQIAANDETITQEQLNRELLRLEIEKNQNLLALLQKGTKEYVALETQIAEQRLKLEDDTNKEIIKNREELQAKLLAAVKTTVEGIATIVQDVSPLFESVGQTALATLSNIATQVPDLLAKFQDETLSQNDKIAAGLSFVASSIGQINDIVQDGSERRIEALNNEEAERIASLERQKEEGLITEEQLAAGITQIEGEYAKKRREQQKKAFQLEKGIRIVQAVAQTAAAALAAYTSGLNVPIIGPAIAPVFAGIAAAFGAAQVALIASQKFPDEGGGATGGATTPAVPSTPALGSITPTQFEPSVFGTGAQQEQVFGATTNPNQSGNVLRAYVVESDIASTSNRLNSIRTTSEL
jgi:hypothetical protein